MAATVSLRLDDELFDSMRKKARKLHLTQTQYIRKAIILLNKTSSKKERSERLKKVSLRVRKGSMHVNKEFSKIERDPID